MLALIAIGMTCFLWGVEGAQATAIDPARGNWLAAGAGLCWALTVIGLRWLGREEPDRRLGAMPAVVLGNAFVFLVCLPALGDVTAISAGDGSLLAFLGIVQIGVAYMLLTAALRRVPALEASLLLLIEPVLSPVWAWWFHGERVGALALAGGGLILAATAIPSVYDLVRRSEAAAP